MSRERRTRNTAREITSQRCQGVGVTFPRIGPRPKFVPPVSWYQAADERTRKDVKAIVTAGFEMARRKPIRSRDQA